jgi:DNA repair exonuclease SbcCD ATPase subunit
MATLTKVSPSRMGPPRFGNRPHNIDTSVKTYQLTPEQLERYRNGENLDDILKEDEGMKKTVIAYSKYEEVVAERDELKKQLEELQAKQTSEVKYVNVDYKTKYEELSRDYEKLVREAEEAEQKAKELEHWKEMFETAMSDKERLHKENLLLENQVQRLKEVNDELTAKNESYFADLMRLEQEVKGLRLYALQKLHIDVYGA